MVSTGSAPAAAARWCSVLSAACLVILSACEEHVTDPADLIPSSPSDAIVDAPRGGKIGFYWLPPMVPKPTSPGTFDPNVTNAEVTICALSGSACGAELITFSTTSTPSITIDPGGETYSVHWRTKSFNLDPSQFYRIQVRVGSLLLGYADVDVVGQSQDLKSVTSDFVGLVKDHPMNIKFRIETGFVPPLVPEPLRFSALEAGDSHTCAIEAGTYQAYCWGFAGPGFGSSTSPVAVSVGLKLVAISAGNHHTCGLTTAGAAYCWGNNFMGELGDGTTTGSASPVAVAGGLTFLAISAGYEFTCALARSDKAYCWGKNRFGQLGDGTMTSSTKPVAVVAP